MKQKDIKKQLTLKKETVADLAADELNSVKGGSPHGCTLAMELCFTKPNSVCYTQLC